MAGCTKDETPEAPPYRSCPFRCSAIPVSVSFSDAFSWNELDTVILKKYSYGSGFTQLEESTIYTLADTISYVGNPFTVRTFKDLTLTADYDYEIVIPATSLTYRVKDMVEPEKYMDYGCQTKSYSCEEPITEFSVSGGEYQLRSLYYDDSPVYIQLKK
jgi:hypothetical protein